jgi:hypothetical protein
VPKDKPSSPPIVLMGGREVHAAFLIAWELGEGDGRWSAWVMWIRERAGRPYRHQVLVPADMVRPAEAPAAYHDVPRRVRGRDGVIRPWSTSAASSRRPRGS